MTSITATQSDRLQDGVRAVILLNGGGSNFANQAEKDSIIGYAVNQTPPIKIYTIYYDRGSGSSVEVAMLELASRTGGKFYRASTPRNSRLHTTVLPWISKKSD